MSKQIHELENQSEKTMKKQYKYINERSVIKSHEWVNDNQIPVSWYMSMWMKT